MKHLPAHEDRTPSLSITPGADKVLLNCFAGCTPAAIVQALGLTLADLFVSTPTTNGHKRIVKVYDYYDASGMLVHQTVRYEPKDFRQRRPDPTHPGDYLWNLKGIEPVPYNLPAILAAMRAGEIIHLTEGEKDADTLIALGLVGTTVPMGAKYWRDSYSTTLTGAHVVVWPDNDKAGQESIAKVQRVLTGKAQTLRMAVVPAPHKDVTDWIEAGGTRADVDTLVQAAPPLTPPPGPSPAAPTGPEPPLPYSDYTNALAFVRDHWQGLRYCYPWATWLVWTSTHWQRDTSGEVMRLAKQTVKRLARCAEALDDVQARALMAHVKSSLSTGKLKALVENAQSEPGIAVQPGDLDADPWVLNCTNGTLDLHTGTLAPHLQQDLITKCLTIPYEPEAPCPTWDAFLWRIMGGSQGEDSPDLGLGDLEARSTADTRAQELIAYLQRTAGYTLTGSTREQCLFLGHGPTKTGKSTYLATLRKLLGPYGQQADMESFMKKDRPEVRNDLAALAGTRYVYAVESQDGKRLSESLVKQITGGVDAITARFLYEELFEFKPQFKVYIGTNHLPQIKDSDDAIWERMRRIPFIVQIPKTERDKDLDVKLQQELPGILAWAVQGCLAWQQHNDLCEPAPVLEATQAYRTEMDTLGHFLEECCVVGPVDVAKVKASLLMSAYQAWCKRTGTMPLANRAFIDALEKRGYARQRGTANQYYWNGLWLVNTGDERYEARDKEDET